MSQEEIDKFCKLYQKTIIKLLPSAIDFFKKYGGSFRNAYIDLNQPEYNQDIFLDCFGIPYVRYKGENQNGKNARADSGT